MGDITMDLCTASLHLARIKPAVHSQETARAAAMSAFVEQGARVCSSCREWIFGGFAAAYAVHAMGLKRDITRTTADVRRRSRAWPIASSGPSLAKPWIKLGPEFMLSNDPGKQPKIPRQQIGPNRCIIEFAHVCQSVRLEPQKIVDVSRS